LGGPCFLGRMRDVASPSSLAIWLSYEDVSPALSNPGIAESDVGLEAARTHAVVRDGEEILLGILYDFVSLQHGNAQVKIAETPECRLTVLRDEVIPPGGGRGAYFAALAGGEETPELHGFRQLDHATRALRAPETVRSACVRVSRRIQTAHNLVSAGLALAGNGIVRLGVVLRGGSARVHGARTSRAK
jgi:hypothetical protein